MEPGNALQAPVMYSLRTLDRTLKLDPSTAGPRLVQYVPTPGLLRVGVSIFRTRERIDLQPSEVPIKIAKSSDFSLFAASERVDLYSWIFAAATAIITGIGTFYIKNDTFGSFQDYCGLVRLGSRDRSGQEFSTITTGIFLCLTREWRSAPHV